ncbi:hypothetical protein [Bradyrhizobium archetypum]|uniref:hypothetical protein n=1 Tax=Bradyrhizobium archetypum TaxID=2721160 RepID=UPI001F2771BA|nr:hypothetical protein [Bradyrhizobium archetypum]
MIYPTPAKQNSSLGSPYADLFREFQSRIVREHSVLFTMGYTFGDEHTFVDAERQVWMRDLHVLDRRTVGTWVSRRMHRPIIRPWHDRGRAAPRSSS